jgi:transposase
MVKIDDITIQEKDLLQNHYRTCQCALIRERAHAILLSSQSRKIADIAEILLRNPETIRQWLHRFKEHRLSSIFHEYQSNAGKLTTEQKEQIKITLSQPPSEQGLPGEFWNVTKLKKYIQATFGVIYESDRSYHYLLQFCGLSFREPTPFDERRNVKAINQRLKEIHAEITAYIKNDEWEVFVADETRITWEAEIRRAWLRRNEKTILRVHRDNQYQNFFGVLNMKTGKSHAYRLNWQNQETIIGGLRRLLKRCSARKKVCIIWDNARWHKGKEIRKALSNYGALKNVHLINFPPYAPDVNPQEHVWKFAKDKISNDRLPDTFRETIKLFQRTITSNIFDYKIPEFILR